MNLSAAIGRKSPEARKRLLGKVGRRRHVSYVKKLIERKLPAGGKKEAVGKKYAVGDTFLAQSTIVAKKYSASAESVQVIMEAAAFACCTLRAHRFPLYRLL